MKKFLLGLLATVLVFSFNSCKKCYDCTKSDVACYDCAKQLPTCGTCTGAGQNVSICEDQNGYAQAKQACIALAGVGAVWTETQGQLLRDTACGTTQDGADINASLLEGYGYICTKRSADQLSQEVCGSNSTNAGGTKTAMEAAGYTCTAK